MTVVIWICAVLVLAGAALAIVRAERGPSMLDRTVALDVVLTTLIAAVALYAAVERRAEVVPVLVVLSLVGFVGSVSIARFAAVEPKGEGRVLTRAQAAVAEALAELDDAQTGARSGSRPGIAVDPAAATRERDGAAPPDDESGGPAGTERR
jgi:multicomponent Na+:H+ antiporter subunit F